MNFTSSPFERMMKEVPHPGWDNDNPCKGCRYYKECKGKKKQCRKKFRALIVEPRPSGHRGPKGGAKLPKMDVLKEEGRKLTAKKKQLYGEYQKARRDMQEIVTIKANIDTLMGYTEPGRKQEKER